MNKEELVKIIVEHYSSLLDRDAPELTLDDETKELVKENFMKHLHQEHDLILTKATDLINKAVNSAIIHLDNSATNKIWKILRRCNCMICEVYSE